MGDEPGFQLDGDGPTHYERELGPLMAPFVALVVERAAPRPGQTVVDLACGTGFMTRAVASRVAPGGQVVGVDLNGGMLAVARQASRPAMPATGRDAPGAPGAPAATPLWVQAAAGALPFPAAIVDALVCQQGIQFFPDLRAAMADAGRALRPRGRLVATAWSPPDRNPYFAAQYGALERVLGPDPVAGFRAAVSCDPTAVVAALTAAGFAEVEAETVEAEVTLPPLDDFAARHLAVLPVAPALGARPGGFAEAGRLVVEAMADRLAPDGSLTMPFASLVVTALR
jgi:ubiquinone/menaquinone biosynthesis C-methylase UbiE